MRGKEELASHMPCAISPSFLKILAKTELSARKRPVRAEEENGGHGLPILISTSYFKVI